MPLSDPQRQVILCNKRFRILFAGRRFGKTFVAIQELAKFARFLIKGLVHITKLSSK